MGKTALPGAKRLNAFAVNPDTLVIVGLDTDDGPEHPLWDERIHLPLDEGFVLNVARNGVLENVIVRKNGPLVEVVAGRQRVRASREVNRRNAGEDVPLVLVPVTVKRPRGDSDAAGVMISENENRQDSDPLTRASQAARQMNFGATEHDVAITFGISKQAVKNLLSLLELSDKVKKAVQKRQISATAATELRDLTHAEQNEKLAEMLATGATGVVEARRQRKARKNGTPTTPRGKAVGVKTLRQVAANEEFLGTLSPDAKDILLWILGDETRAKRIKGLTAVLKADQPPKPE
jgi:ParB family chromosome partitioning protein